MSAGPDNLKNSYKIKENGADGVDAGDFFERRPRTNFDRRRRGLFGDAPGLILGLHFSKSGRRPPGAIWSLEKYGFRAWSPGWSKEAFGALESMDFGLGRRGGRIEAFGVLKGIDSGLGPRGDRNGAFGVLTSIDFGLGRRPRRRRPLRRRPHRRHPRSRRPRSLITIIAGVGAYSAGVAALSAAISFFTTTPTTTIATITIIAGVGAGASAGAGWFQKEGIALGCSSMRN